MAPRKQNGKSNKKAIIFSEELHQAIIWENVKGVNEQISRGASLKASDSRGQTPLQIAIKTKNINIVKIIVENGADIHQETRFGHPFYNAASLGFTDLLKYFLDKKVNVNVRNRDGETALHAVCQNVSDVETCSFLLENGADPTLENKKKKTPLYWAYRKLKPICNSLFTVLKSYATPFTSPELEKWVAAVNFISKFLDYGVDLSNILLECPMIFPAAVIAENVELVKYLATSVDCNIFDNSIKDELSPLQLAISKKNLEIIQILVDNGADIHYETSLGLPLHYAVTHGSCDIVNYFLQKGADVNRKDRRGNTSLHSISNLHRLENSTEICRALLNHGAALEELNHDCLTSLQYAVINNNVDIAKVLVVAGADVRHETKRGSPFHLAASKDNLEILDFLLNSGIHIDEKNKNGYTALHTICMSLSRRSSLKSCEYLLTRGANIDAKNRKNKTPLFYALQSLRNSLNSLPESENWRSEKTDNYDNSFTTLLPILSIIHNFLKHGANLDDVLKKCPYILHVAVAAENEEFVKYLLQRNINVNRRIDKDVTPLHCAAFFGRLESMATLIQHGANIDATMSKKLTPLHLATYQGHVSFAIALMNFGADINAQDDWGQTALHKAAWVRNVAILWALLLREADTEVTDINDERADDLLISHHNARTENSFFEANAIISCALFGFRFCPIYFLYDIMEEFQYSDDLGTSLDYEDTFTVHHVGWSLQQNKEKILKMDEEELIEMSEAENTDSVLAQEVLLMRGTAICNDVTLYDLITEDCNKIAGYLVDTKIPDFAAFSRNGFYYLLQKRMNAVRRHNLFGWAAYELGQCLQVRLPQELMDKVVKNLGEHDVRNILRATIGYEGEDDEAKIQEAKEEFETTYRVRLCTRNPRSSDGTTSDDDFYDGEYWDDYYDYDDEDWESEYDYDGYEFE